MASNQNKESSDGLQDRVVKVARVAKVVKGGRRFSFSALVVVGDGKSRVGFGIGKAGEVPDAIRKASEQAKKSMVQVPSIRGTLPFEVDGRFGSSQVRMYPAKEGKGVIAGGAVRLMVELAGLHNIVCKVHGSKNPHNVVRATLDGLLQLRSSEEVARVREISPEHVQQQRASKKQRQSAAV